MKRLLLVAVLALILTGAAVAGSLTSSRNFDMKVGDRAFVQDAGVICTDQLLSALKGTRRFTRTLGRYALICLPEGRSVFRSYSVRISELGIVVEDGQRVVFSRRNP